MYQCGKVCAITGVSKIFVRGSNEHQPINRAGNKATFKTKLQGECKNRNTSMVGSGKQEFCFGIEGLSRGNNIKSKSSVSTYIFHFIFLNLPTHVPNPQKKKKSQHHRQNIQPPPDSSSSTTNSYFDTPKKKSQGTTHGSAQQNFLPLRHFKTNASAREEKTSQPLPMVVFLAKIPST